MTDTTSPPTDRLHTVTVVFASLVVALPLLVGQVIEAGFDAAFFLHNGAGFLRIVPECGILDNGFELG